MGKKRIARNLAANSAVPHQGFIFNQHAAPAKDMVFGRYRGDHNGCGWIAVYNVLQLIGRERPAPAVIADLERRRGAVLGGLFGIWPGAVVRALRGAGCTVTVYRRAKRFDSLVPPGGVFILWFAHRRGMHYAACRREGDRYTGYNVYSGSRGPEDLGPSLGAFLKRNRYWGLRLYLVDAGDK